MAQDARSEGFETRPELRNRDFLNDDAAEMEPDGAGEPVAAEDSPDVVIEGDLIVEGDVVVVNEEEGEAAQGEEGFPTERES